MTTTRATRKPRAKPTAKAVETRGRKSKYAPALVAAIIKLLAKGCVIADVCAQVHISQDTFFQWIKKYPEFSEKVSHAKARANVGAVKSLRLAMTPHDIGSHTTKSFKETRLRKAKDKETGAIVEVPYEYVKVEHSETVSREFDWRAALEFLKRRDPDNWGDTLVIKLSPEDRDFLKANDLEPSDAVHQWIGMMREEANANANAA